MRLLFKYVYWIYRLHWRITRPIVLGVRLILVQDGQVLLVRHTYQYEWFFPGGALKRGETLVQGAMREGIEESGAHCRTEPRLLGIYTSNYEGKNDHIAVFFTNDFTLAQRTDRWEIDECKFFPLEALPEDLSPGCARRVRDYLAGPGPYVGKW